MIKYIKNRSGFSLIEIMVGVAVFLLFAIGIYGGAQFIFKVVYQSRLRILETAILNEQMEIIRNLPYENIGIINGSPSGVLTQTVTTTRNNIAFNITRTIRNVDDAFDGTAGGTPNDTAPADYKLVDLEITCVNCGQRGSVNITSYIPPKLFEGDPTHGALFISVIDSTAQPVQGASVQIISTSTSPIINMSDTTDNDGMLKIFDLGAGMNVYNIIVTKSGFVTDETLTVTPTILHPVKPLASVEAQYVNNISFSIDSASTINLSTKNSVCSTMANVPVNIFGTKLISTNPDVLKINRNITTNGSGENIISNLDWDTYGLRATGYDLLGSIPALPINISAGAVQDVQLILGSDSANSLVVSIIDNINKQSISNATVRLSGVGYDQTKTTGVGFVRQTDWSGGSGQLIYSNETKYWSDDGKIDINNPVGDIKLAVLGQGYLSSGSIESSVFDLGTSVNLVNINWEPLAQPAETGADSVRWQIATSNSSTSAVWNYYGPDGTGGTYYTTVNNVINAIHNGNRYLRYKLFLSTDNTDFTPTVSDMNVTYITSCTPPGQAYFGNLVNQAYDVTVTRTGYQTKTDSITVLGDVVFGSEMVAQ